MSSNSLDHSILQWEITDFSLCLTNDVFIFKSPEFQLSRSRTKWFLELSVDGSRGQIVKMAILLCRNSEDDDADDIPVRFVFSMQSADHSFAWKGLELVSVFKKVTRCGENLERYFKRSELLSTRDIRKDTMVVRCEMMLVYDAGVQLMKIDPDADALARDLLDMWDSGNQGNAVLIAGGNEIHVHKEVLSARSDVFAKLLRSSDSRIISPFSAQSMLILLAYIYSDKLPNLAPERLPGVELYECASHYQVHGLMEALEPQSIGVKSSIQAEECYWCGQIPNSTLAGSKPFCSFPKMFNRTLFQFTVHRAPLQKSLIVFVQLWNASEELTCFSMGLDLWNSANCRQDHRTALVRPNSNNCCSHTVVIPGENLYGESNMSEGNLLVNFVLRIRFKTSSQTDSSITFSSVSDFRIPCVQRSLQFQMKELWVSSTFADAMVSAGDRGFKVHRSILCARSSFFKREFEHSKSISSGLTVAVLDHLLFYIYTGLVSSTNPLRLMDLHSAAVQYGVPRLQDACSSLLKEAPLEARNVCIICLFARRTGQLDLEQKCIDFISKNADLVFDKPGWALLKSKDIILGSEILVALGGK